MRKLPYVIIGLLVVTCIVMGACIAGISSDYHALQRELQSKMDENQRLRSDNVDLAGEISYYFKQRPTH